VSLPSDDQLLKQLQAHQPQSLSFLFDSYGDLMYGLAYSLLSNRQEAEDLVQEVFAQLWQHCSYNPERGSFKTFLMVMVRSRSLDRLRAHKSRQNTAIRAEVLDSQSNSASATTSQPFDVAARDEISQRVQIALAELPENQRQALELSYFRGLTQAEIAQQLSVPLGTVKSWFRLSFTKLRQSLNDLMTE
jgi:RNA polymerase sigma-70 factor, ECF subfamily